MSGPGSNSREVHLMGVNFAIVGGLNRIAVTGRITATMAAPLSHCGLAMYEARLHIKKMKRFISICVYKGLYAAVVWIE